MAAKKWNTGLTKKTDKRVAAMSKKISATSKKNRPVNVIKTMNKEEMEKKYFENKVSLDTVRDDATLNKWSLLSENKKLGKKIWGREFTLVRLAKDMEMPFSTVQRCISLDKATPRTWKLIKEGKISAFKAAMVLQLKNKSFQKQIIDAVIKGNMSTYQIKSFKPNSIADVNLWRHAKAVEKEYSSKDAAFRSFNLWIGRGAMFMLLPISSVGPTHKDEIVTGLRLLHKRIGTYLDVNDTNAKRRNKNEKL